MSTPFQISLAPDQLWQAINPMTFNQQGAQFGFINIDLGDTADSDLERKILDNGWELWATDWPHRRRAGSHSEAREARRSET